MQSEANALAVKLRDEYHLSRINYERVENIIDAMTSNSAVTIADADVWLGNLIDSLINYDKLHAQADTFAADPEKQ